MSEKPEGMDAAMSQELAGARDRTILGGQETLSPFPSHSLFMTASFLH